MFGIMAFYIKKSGRIKIMRFRKNTYSKKYKGEYITIMEGRYGGWGIFFAGQKIWNYEGRKIRSFEEAEKVAFEVFEEYSRYLQNQFGKKPSHLIMATSVELQDRHY